ncbi:hypothetical protein [Arthrobacter sp. N1]|uniref:hypothetical protein n=1 Tax=Arthrobacter sp. N1 TaxID=619291 RepID=UPI003BAE75E3
MSNQQRVSRGIPTGGQFSTTSRQVSGVTLTGPARKRDRRGTHFTVTLPDGTVATRASQASTYSHVVAASAEKPELVIRERSLRVSESVARIEDIDRVIANPDIKMRYELVSRGWEGGTDPHGRNTTAPAVPSSSTRTARRFIRWPRSIATPRAPRRACAGTTAATIPWPCSRRAMHYSHS